MSYQYPRFISDYNYQVMLDQFLHHRAPTGVEPRIEQAQATGDYLAVAGIVTPSLGTGSLGLAYVVADITPASPLVANRNVALQAAHYDLVLEGSGGPGDILYTHPFSLSESIVNGAADVFFLELLPHDPATVRVVLRRDGVEVDVLVVSPHSPAVTLLYPNGGESFGDSMTVAWTGSDTDGDDLFYTLQYSPDNGQTWYALAVNLTGTSFDVESLDFMSGSDEMLIRVIATDGVNTTMDESDGVFNVDLHDPQAFISTPHSWSVYSFGDTIKLRGFAIDPEDVSLNSSAFSWTSSISGTLGTGTELWVSDLTTGTHRITLTVTDSHGQTGTDEIILFVGTTPERIYLPFVLRRSS
jgi:hypothetical protein